MKTNKTIRSTVSMMLIFFAVAATSCKKEVNIAPTTPTAPVVPTIPVTPAVSMKPTFIVTAENGTTIRKQGYIYDAQGKLLKYVSATSGGEDSVLLFTNNVAFKRGNSSVISHSLTFNADKTFSSLFSATDQINFESSGTQLSRMSKIRTGQTPLSLGEFVYVQNKIAIIGAEIRIDINYYNDLPYQKGINEIPVVLKPIQFFKVMEQENATNTVLYNKLIKQIIMNFGGGRFELHDYTYTLDANNRVTEIRDVITLTTSSSSTQKTRVSNISY